MIPETHRVVSFLIPLLMLVAVACQSGARESPRVRMTDAELDAFFDVAYNELQAKQAALGEEYGMGTYSRWHYDQTTAKLQFFDKDDRLALEADFIDIGSYSPVSNTWMWGWANESILPGLRKKAEGIKDLEGLTGLELFGEERAFPARDEAMAWGLTAVAVKHLGLLGCYRAPSSSEGGPTTFLGITKVTKLPEAAAEPPSGPAT